ncbi:hypothetical protein [Ralstonia sp. 25mfcol4.1]|nr:hypothetical protein [Ralstonia sp. 25mfcol4.1]
METDPVRQVARRAADSLEDLRLGPAQCRGGKASEVRRWAAAPR